MPTPSQLSCKVKTDRQPWNLGYMLSPLCPLLSISLLGYFCNIIFQTLYNFILERLLHDSFHFLYCDSFSDFFKRMKLFYKSLWKCKFEGSRVVFVWFFNLFFELCLFLRSILVFVLFFGFHAVDFIHTSGFLFTFEIRHFVWFF